VQFTTNEDVITGPKLRLKLEDSVGYFEEPEYAIKRRPPRAKPGEVLPPPPAPATPRRIDFEARITTACTMPPIDFAPATPMVCRTGQPRTTTRSRCRLNAPVFKGSILYTPWLSFSLNNQRKTRLLSDLRSTARADWN